MKTNNGQTTQASTEASVTQKRERDNRVQADTSKSLAILFSVIFGIMMLFLLAIALIFYCHRRNGRNMEKSGHKVTSIRLQKLEEIAPTRTLEEWRMAVKRSLDPPQGIDAQFVCVVCLDCVERTQEIHHLKCLHIFHKECLEKWYLCGHSTCPMCQDTFFPEHKEQCIPTASLNFSIFA